MNKIKKTLFTLAVDNFSPEIIELTFPLMKAYANKIGADFHVITERKHPDMPPVYEKLQIYDLGREMKNDWNIFFDADALIHPETIDFTQIIHKDTVLHNGADMAMIRWKYDEYFLRNGRNIGSCNWFTIGSDWCLDLWKPLDIPYKQALENIQPTVSERNNGITAEHLIDDYTLSRNIAKYGLKFLTAREILDNIGLKEANFFWHQYTITPQEKVVELKKMIKNWGV